MLRHQVRSLAVMSRGSPHLCQLCPLSGCSGRLLLWIRVMSEAHRGWDLILDLPFVSLFLKW